jgi:hypothetical protein
MIQLYQEEVSAMNFYSFFLQKRILSIMGLLTISVFVMIVMSGCLENYGRLNRDHAVTAAFETGQLPSEYHYHFFGIRNHPRAVMGLRPDWTLKSSLWRTVELNTEEFKFMTKWVWEDLGYYKYGANILDPEFEKIGIIYTSSWMAAVKVDKDTKTVEVMPHVWNGGP